MKKIAIYIPRWYPSIGGMEIHVSNLIKHATKYKFTVLTNALPGYPEIEDVSDRFTIKRIGPNDRNFVPIGTKFIHRTTFPYRHIADKKRLANVQNYIEKNDFDLFHAHYPYIPHTYAKISSIMNKPVSKNNLIFSSDKPSLLTVHGLLSKLSNNPVYDVYEKHIVKKNKNIIAVDRIIVDYIEKNSSNKQLWYIPNSVNTELFSLSPIKESKQLKIGFIGRLESSRGTKLLEQLINKIPDDVEMKLVLSGSSSSIDNFKRKYASSQICINSNIENTKLPSFLHEIDVLFNPVLAEGISRISLEAMACGRPVIMLDKGDRSPVKHNQTGFLVKPDINSILSQVDEIAKTKDELNKMGEQARKAVEKEFSNDVIIPKTEEVYRKVMEAA